MNIGQVFGKKARTTKKNEKRNFELPEEPANQDRKKEKVLLRALAPTHAPFDLLFDIMTHVPRRKNEAISLSHLLRPNIERKPRRHRLFGNHTLSRTEK